MCGIVGITGERPVAERLLTGLKRLEYRGYDSAGVATLAEGRINRRRASGKLSALAARLAETPLSGTTGIGHTRWATHGAPTELNAHPHATERVAVVHNGIIENYRTLLADLAGDGYLPASQTDSEVVALLVTRAMDLGLSAEEAVESTLGKLKGAYALVFLFEGQDGLLVAARHGSPLAVGHGDGEMFVGSDALALSPFTERVTYLEDGDWAVLEPGGATLFARSGPVARPLHQIVSTQTTADKGPFRHFMLKEIHEQPEALSRVIGAILDHPSMTLLRPPALPFRFSDLKQLSIIGCGTAYLAGATAKYWFERFARLPVQVDIASEMRYREPPLDPGELAMFISQSGETADTLAALRYCRAADQHVIAVVNVPQSSIAREADLALPLMCGPEIGVASTKAFTAQLTVLLGLALQAAHERGTIEQERLDCLLEALCRLPAAISATLELDDELKAVSRVLARARNVLFLGRGLHYPIALEGALKLKEISYIHAEGYAAGELKHGPIALVEEAVPVVVLAPSDELSEKTFSNMQEVAARGAPVILVTDEAGRSAGTALGAHILTLPRIDPALSPIISAVAVQLLAYHTATQLGADVDQPRNLAKSVTVE
jgi:glucosamine--fructose-6-phosphate aminotransferase (isomerizing)